MPDPRIFFRLSGRDLPAFRRERGLTQAELARIAGIGRQTVIVWKGKAVVNPWGWAPRRMLDALGVRVVQPAVSHVGTTTRAEMGSSR